MWLDVSVHDPFGVAVIQSLLCHRVNILRSAVAQCERAHFEKLEHVKSDIVIGESRVEHFEVDVVDVFCDQAWDLGSRIANHVQQGYDIRTSGQVLKNLYFPLDLLLLDGFEDFDDTLFVVDDVYTLEDLADRRFWCQVVFLGLGDRRRPRSPLNTSPVLLSERSRNGLGIPTGPADCLRKRHQKWERRANMWY